VQVNVWVQDLLVTLRKMGIEVPPTSSLHCKLRLSNASPPHHRRSHTR
jgi:hypothetical protein